MGKLLRTTGLIFALLGIIAVLIIFPAIWLGIVDNWKIIFLGVGYFCFFLGTVWRVVRYGQLANSEEDRQIQATSGRLASLLVVIGLPGVHWLSLYTFSLQNQTLNETVELALSVAATTSVGAAIVINQVAIRTLGKFFDRLAIKSDHQLVTHGIYSLIRHPIYTSYILLFFGFCAMLSSLWGLALLLVVCMVWFSNRIRIEEQMLEEEFGEAYRSYCQRTNRLFPYVY